MRTFRISSYKKKIHSRHVENRRKYQNSMSLDHFSSTMMVLRFLSCGHLKKSMVDSAGRRGLGHFGLKYGQLPSFIGLSIFSTLSIANEFPFWLVQINFPALLPFAFLNSVSSDDHSLGNWTGTILFLVTPVWNVLAVNSCPR